ncbi:MULTISPECIES: protein kinase domain-containing protein [unclassified Modestobacter]|uniref:protein kinase domain-containing protein n=1 Tax=unclassified Modestobacter TaxID=2643866 RepID=UPI0022AAC2C3|nr:MULTISPECIES: protein kinase [unclassified Modestobacter]MCZ2826725.1 protein kinase [Modestobacter sp. VKM Ac-2981]MCZ2855105.1 protein kinase [Modestobacter sp. VKM Ac-2982]
MHPNGRLLGGRYELQTLIASGGMGQVWQARDTVLGRDVAVKVLRSEYTANATFLARFRAEAQHSAGLVHPHIATLFDYGEVLPDASPRGEHLAYLVMELVRGESLATLLRRERRLSPDRTLQVLRQCAAGLAAAHAADVVHRDVKPGNVLLADDGGVKLTDFGVAVSATSVPLTVTGEVVGTAHYLSPEQAAGTRATPASDVYALGLVGYECLAGQRGFDGGDAVEVALRRIREVPPPLPDDVPAPVRALIDRAIAKDPTERFADGAALRAAIDDVLAGRPVGGPDAEPRTAVMPAIRTAELPVVRIPTPPPPFPATQGYALPPAEDEDDLGDEPERRRRWPFLVATLLAFLVAMGGTFGLLQLATDRADPPPAAQPAPAAEPTPPSEPVVQLVSLSTVDYVGRPVTEVQAELVERGLVPTLRPLQTGDVSDGSVIALDPVGQVLPGAAVTLTHAVAPPPPPPPPPAPEPAPAPAPAPTPAAEPAPTEDAQLDEEDIEEAVERWRERRRDRDD